MDPVDFDPMNAARAQELVPLLAQRCLALPETNEGDRFGHKVWRAGKKSFCAAEHQDGRLWFTFWVGRDMQPALTADARFRVPVYTGHNGWILLDVEQHVDWDQVNDLLLADDHLGDLGLQRLAGRAQLLDRLQVIRRSSGL